MANIHLGIDIGTFKAKSGRVTVIKFGCVTINVLDLGSDPNMSDFPRFAVRRTVYDHEGIHQSAVTYGDDIHETCRLALAFDDGKTYRNHREVIIGAYNEVVNFIDSSAYEQYYN